MKAILTWHSIDDTASVISVNRDQLKRSLDWLASGRVEVVPLTSIVAKADSDAVALTFDDGFASFSQIAAPMLSDRGLPATVFVVPGKVGGMNAWSSGGKSHEVPSFSLMTWDQIRSVRDAGFDIGGHGLTHAALAGLESKKLTNEVRDCASEIEANVGVRPATFAYPYGHHDNAAVTAVGQEYSLACTTRFATLGPDDNPLELPRLDMYYFRENQMLETWGTARFSAFVGLRNAARRIKTAILRP